MRTYTIRRTEAKVPLDGRVDDTPWADADVARIDEFPWYDSGEKQATRVRALYDDAGLALQFRAEDAHVSASVTELNGPVSDDSCVEFFASPVPAERPDYVNFEANCCGQLLVGFGPDRESRSLIDPTLAADVDVNTSVDGLTKEERPDDDGWWLAARLPFETLRAFTGLDVDPGPGTEWRGNFYRCGGETDPQYACWNRVDAPDPDFHRPESFGELRFA